MIVTVVHRAAACGVDRYPKPICNLYTPCAVRWYVLKDVIPCVLTSNRVYSDLQSLISGLDL